MSKDMKLIMENYRKGNLFAESVQQPQTWGELSQKIMLTVAAEKWPRVGKSLLKLGWNLASGALKNVIQSVEGLEEVLDFIPDDLQEKLEMGVEVAIEELADFAVEKGGSVAAFFIDDIMGMDDSLTKNLAGFSALNIDDAYEKLINKDILKRWAKNIIRSAKNVDPNERLPDLNSKLEQDLQNAVGAHPDQDQGDVRR